MKFEKGEETELKKFEDILAQCIEDIKAGRASIEDCLDRYPSVREQLEPLLRIALEIREPPDVKSSPAFKVRARVWLMEQIHGMQTVTKWPWSRYNKQTKQISHRRRFSMASIILVIVLALSAAGGGVAYAAQDSLPGDTLYPVKISTEQVIMALPGDDVAKAERALNFAERRVQEMEELAERERSQYMEMAVERYRYALNITLARMEQARSRGLAAGNVTERVAEATARHLLVLDRVWDVVPDEAKPAITHAREVSEKGRQKALAALAKENTVRAAEMNMAALEGRLNRIRDREQNREALQIALQQFEAISEFNEEICRIAQEAGLNITSAEELVAEATSKHLEVLADVWEKVPEQAKQAIEEAMANLMIRHQERIQALEQQGGKAPQPPVIPEKVREQVEKRIREQQMEWSVPEGVPQGGSPGQACPHCRR